MSLEIHIECLICTKFRRFRECSGPVFVHRPLMRYIKEISLRSFSHPLREPGEFLGASRYPWEALPVRSSALSPTAYPLHLHLPLVDGWTPPRTHSPFPGGPHPLRLTGQARLNKFLPQQGPSTAPFWEMRLIWGRSPASLPLGTNSREPQLRAWWERVSGPPCSLHSPVTWQLWLWGMGRGTWVLKTCRRPTSRSWCMKHRGRAAASLASTAQTHSFPGQLNFRKEELEVSRQSWQSWAQRWPARLPHLQRRQAQMGRINGARTQNLHLWVEILTKRRNEEAQGDDGLSPDGATQLSTNVEIHWTVCFRCVLWCKIILNKRGKQIKARGGLRWHCNTVARSGLELRLPETSHPHLFSLLLHFFAATETQWCSMSLWVGFDQGRNPWHMACEVKESHSTVGWC